MILPAYVNQKAFDAFDGDSNLLLLLPEHYDEENSIAIKTAIFRERTIRQKIKSVSSLE